MSYGSSKSANWLLRYSNFFSPLDKLAEGLYILLALIAFLNLRQIISGSTGPIFTIFSPNERYLREFSRLGVIFFIPLETLPWQPILCRKQNTNHVRFLQFLYHMKAFWCRWQSWNFFSISQGTSPWQPILFCTGLVCSEPKYLRICWTDFHYPCNIW